MSDDPHRNVIFTARVTIDGQRQRPITWGYRPNFVVDGINYMAMLTTKGADLRPGQTYDVEMHGVLPEKAAVALRSGTAFEWKEATTPIASGCILEIVRTFPNSSST